MAHNSTKRVVGVILAGGMGKRFSNYKNKLLVKIADKPLLMWCINNCLSSKLIKDWLLVTGFDRERIVDVVKTQKRLILIHNKKWQHGVFTSRDLAIRYAIDNYSDLCGILFIPADMPFINEKFIDKIATEFISSKYDVVYGTDVAGTKGHPVIFNIESLSQFLGYRGYGSEFLKEKRLRVKEILLPGFSQIDLDTEDDVKKIERYLVRNERK